MLFWFDYYEIHEYVNDKEPTASTDISLYPVRAFFDDHGKISKLQLNANEVDSSYHLKVGIIRALQLDWAKIQDALKSDGEKEFETTVATRSGECKLKGSVHADSATEVCVTMTRKISDCTSQYVNDYEKFKDSSKKWFFHFDHHHAKNFHHAEITIEDYFKADENILIKSGFHFHGCHPIEGEWDASNLEDGNRQFVPRS